VLYTNNPPLRPLHRFLGLDFSVEAVTWANDNIPSGVTNLSYEVQDASTMLLKDRFDWITTFDAIHDQVITSKHCLSTITTYNQAAPDVVLANIRKALRPEGVYLMQEIHASSSHAGINTVIGLILLHLRLSIMFACY